MLSLLRVKCGVSTPVGERERIIGIKEKIGTSGVADGIDIWRRFMAVLA